MTFLKKQRQQNTEKGVTLLLAILVLAAMTTIVFSIAAIVYNEIKTSADLTRTEPIITASEALAEESLFNTMRGFAALPNCTNPNSATLNGVAVSTCASYYLSDPYVLDLTASARKDYYLYNPENISASPGYTSVSVQMIGGFQGVVYLCNWSDVDCVASGAPLSSQTISSSGTTTWNSPALNPGNQYILSIVNSAVNTGSYAIDATPQGLPAGVTTIEERGSRQGLTRKLEVTVPQ